MLAVRKWSIRHARKLEWFYARFEWCLVKLHPLFARIGYARLEKPVAFVERNVKGFLFDCQMCGNCVLGSTGMSCPMNCPKQLRNGPCGGVRADGNCEVKPDMACVWAAAWRGSQRMRGSEKILEVQVPPAWAQKGSSAWLREARRGAAAKSAAGEKTALREKPATQAKSADSTQATKSK